MKTIRANIDVFALLQCHKLRLYNVVDYAFTVSNMAIKSMALIKYDINICALADFIAFGNSWYYISLIIKIGIVRNETNEEKICSGYFIWGIVCNSSKL